MCKIQLMKVFLSIFSLVGCDILKNNSLNTLKYPDVFRNESVVDNYHGTNVSDPYRWMEDISNNALIKKFVNEQNKITFSYVQQYYFRNRLRERISELWNYPKIYEIEKHGKYYFQFFNPGLENHNILYIQDSLEEPTNRRVFLDPNELSEEGTIALTDGQFSKTGEIYAYTLSKSGSDWQTIHFRNASSGKDLEDKLIKVKFTDISWKGNEGIFYGHYPEFEGDPIGTEAGTDKNQKLSYHKIGTSQDDDPIIFSSLDHPNRLLAIGTAVSSDERILIVPPLAMHGEGSYADNSIYGVKIEDIDRGNWKHFDIVPTYDAKYKCITNDNEYFYFLTNKNAPNNHIVVININIPEANWTIVVPEDVKSVIDWAAPINKSYLVINYLDEVKSKLELWKLDGTFIKNLDIDMGSIEAHSGGRNDQLLFIKFVSFLVPNRIYLLNFTEAVDTEIELKIYDEVTIPGFNPEDFMAYQKLYSSKDGTAIPMFIVHHKDLVKNNQNPAMISGYGGFSINVLPTFSVQRIIFMQHFGGVVGITNLRGGGEFGIEWHQGGSLKNKQNVFDDFQSAAEYLIFNNYTNTGKVVIEGHSNGGLLVGACVNQRPDLFAAAIADVGVMDMLRYHRFTIGHFWISEYGSADDPEYFPVVYNYSPLHKIKLPENENLQYPAVLVTTSDHDDRVVPAHSYKYSAELQYTVGRSERQTNPLLLRVESDAGHGMGVPTSKQIEEQVDIFSFIGQSLNLTYNGEYPPYPTTPPPLPSSARKDGGYNLMLQFVPVSLIYLTIIEICILIKLIN